MMTTLLAGCFVIGYAGAWFMARYAFQFGLVDLPNVRSSHEKPTPRGGGIGIMLSVFFTGLLIGVPLLVWIPAVCLSLVSLFDDKLDLSPRMRLCLQFFASFAVLMTVDWSGSGWLLVVPLFLFFVIFIVGTANFYNFMDGINGIAGITGLVSFALLALFADLEYLPLWQSLLPAGIAAACLGFLPLNVPKARVFMGDVGSVLLGFAFAALVCLLARDLASFVCLVTFLFMFYADALTTLYLRWRNGEKLSQAHRRHLYQVLCNELSVTHWKVSCSYGLLQAIIGGMMLVAYGKGLLWQLIWLGSCGIFFVVVTTIVRVTARRAIVEETR